MPCDSNSSASGLKKRIIPGIPLVATNTRTVFFLPLLLPREVCQRLVTICQHYLRFEVGPC